MKNNNTITRELSDIARDYQASQVKCNELYTLIGKAYYESAKDNPSEDMKELFEKVNAILIQQDKMETRRKFLNGIVVCTNCKADNNVMLSFCGSCGTRLPHKLAVPNDGQVRCTNCGNVMAPEQAFCGSCGTKAPEKEAPVANPVVEETAVPVAETVAATVEEIPPVPVEEVQAPEYYAEPESHNVFCSNCGFKITNPKAAFCPECGNKIAK